MIIKTMVCLAVVIALLTNCYIIKVNAVIFHPDKTDIERAIKCGKDNKRTSLETFSKKWTVNLGREVGWATLYTGFHNVAFKARKAHIEHKELTPKQIGNRATS